MTISKAMDEGYVTDVPYVRQFIPYLTPALLDHVALVNGFEPPAREDKFTYCDLGCGQGVTSVILAVTHPCGVFHGVDFMAGHVEHARRFCEEVGVSTAVFHHTDFASASKAELPKFDYIVCHGVYAWVNECVQRDVRNFIDRHLKPGGLAYISYNAMPGWASDTPFQYLVRSIGRALPGDSQVRVAAGLEMSRTMLAAKVPALVDSIILKDLEANGFQYSQLYLAHEYMNRDWRPLFVTEVREAMYTIGLTPVGSATLMTNFDSFVVGRKARETLATIPDPDLRELVRDYYMGERFRRDVFVRGGQRISLEKQSRRLFASTFSLVRPPEKIKYQVRTPAGSLCFDNETARALVTALAEGPRRLAELAQDLRLDEQDVLANALTLSASRILVPVEETTTCVAKLNRVLLDRLKGPEPIEALALPCGTAARIRSELLRAVAPEQGSKEEGPQFCAEREHGGDPGAADLLAWRAFLCAQGAID